MKTITAVLILIGGVAYATDDDAPNTKSHDATFSVKLYNQAIALDVHPHLLITNNKQTNNERSLSNCWGTSDPSPAYHPVYSAGWTNGYCHYTIDCDSPSYETELDCCKGSYGNQLGNNCIKNLDNPPTLSPTDVGTLYYTHMLW